ncbi:hypothetical protein K493DRAFT_307425 [Basidiobolus meristosporus CBS 931.73]|uniref:Uncharacterized protein n=1 Tax=Basidiobolus meristosporus CBS 931.73 TaxID=1314790 RepID=A0A1Y1XFS1_9FUNG|nr:hypothetical protein K493DRAFT_307425 [Basidiobolus meristosporus CBS 931.73]|eukprot:ORX84567.1 hypothetical protein K493DRAFT_307425 [Basidiobolus meristosporus CBS 931.73]
MTRNTNGQHLPGDDRTTSHAPLKVTIMTLESIDVQTVIAEAETILNVVRDTIDQFPPSLHYSISATPLGDSQIAYSNEPCIEQLGAYYQNTSAPSQEYQPSIEDGDDSEMTEPMQTSETSGEQPGFSGLQGFDISNVQPSHTLLDSINGHSSSKANAVSSSNQFDQTQVIDQTLYQSKQQQPQIITTQPTARALRGGYKKYKRSVRRHFKIRYFSGNRHQV